MTDYLAAARRDDLGYRVRTPSPVEIRRANVSTVRDDAIAEKADRYAVDTLVHEIASE